MHDEKAEDPSLAFMLSRMRHPALPEPLGVFREVERPVYGELVREQVAEAVKARGAGELQSLVTGNETWTVE
jgi:2-oxoglutarate/2-oxoacid ferredoxin oxidoreductase subunit beta